MAQTENNYTGDGTTVLFPFTFPYIDSLDIFVQIDGEQTTEFTLANLTTVEMNTAPALGANVRIYRVTDTDELPATFYSGSTIQAKDLNDNFDVTLYVAQEAQRDTEDAGAALPTAQRAEAKADQAIEIANEAKETADGVEAIAIEAKETADEAKAAADGAASGINSAQETADDALEKAEQALVDADAARQAADAADANADAAQSAADSAATLASSADAKATAAQAKADAALPKDGSEPMTGTLTLKGDTPSSFLLDFGTNTNSGFYYDVLNTLDGTTPDIKGISLQANGRDVMQATEQDVFFFGGPNAAGGLKINQYGTINSWNNSGDFGFQFYGSGNQRPHRVGILRTNGDSTPYTGIQVIGKKKNSNQSDTVLRVYHNGDVENRDNKYSGLSDIRFKSDVVPAASQWEDIKAIEVRSYTFDGDRHIGVVAQEVELVCPGLVDTRKDEDTDEEFKTVAYSILYMKCVKALQEAMERIETLESKLNDLSCECCEVV